MDHRGFCQGLQSLLLSLAAWIRWGIPAAWVSPMCVSCGVPHNRWQRKPVCEHWWLLPRLLVAVLLVRWWSGGSGRGADTDGVLCFLRRSLRQESFQLSRWAMCITWIWRFGVWLQGGF